LASLTRWRMDRQIAGERADCQDQPLPFPNRSVALRGSCRGGSARLPCTNTMPHFLKLSHFIQPVGLYFRASNSRNLGWARSTRACSYYGAEGQIVKRGPRVSTGRCSGGLSAASHNRGLL
jgi:hypothetical protein